MVVTGQVVVTMVRDGALEVEINVPENRISDLRLNQPALITFWALPGLELAGSVREISPMADGQTRTYRVRVSLIEPPPEAQLGMTASVRAVAGRGGGRRIALLPRSAIYQTGNKPHVWLVKEWRVTLQDISIEDFDENQVIVTKNLADGYLVVTAGVHKMHEGRAVRLTAGAEGTARP